MVAVWPAVVDDGNRLTAGEATIPRAQNISTTITMTSGTMRLTYFTARKTEAINGLRVLSGTTAAGATPTLVRAGVYSVASTGDLTLLAAFANSTNVFGGTNTAYSRALTSSFSKVAGVRYAVGLLVISAAAMPTVAGIAATSSSSEAALDPRLAGLVASQSDLPASVTAAGITNSTNMFYAAMEP